jgi:cytochrome c biogenesis protein CcmG, thiol:disulfide interchange protein DsbE
VDTPPEGTPESRGWDRRRTIGAIVGGAIVLGIVVLLAVGLANKDIGTSIQDALVKGERPSAPDITLPVLTSGPGVGAEGSDVTLSRMRGKIVVLNFWASWCEPCKLEAPILEAVSRRYRDASDVVVMGVDIQDLRERARGFIEDNGITYASLRDGTDKAKDTYQVPALPETFLIDPEGRIALKVPGQLTATEQLTVPIATLRREARDDAGTAG